MRRAEIHASDPQGPRVPHDFVPEADMGLGDTAPTVWARILTRFGGILRRTPPAPQDRFARRLQSPPGGWWSSRRTRSRR